LRGNSIIRRRIARGQFRPDCGYNRSFLSEGARARSSKTYGHSKGGWLRR
jgi:hypothetical protein